jgi:hypothetical protein
MSVSLHVVPGWTAFQRAVRGLASVPAPRSAPDPNRCRRERRALARREDAGCPAGEISAKEVSLIGDSRLPLGIEGKRITTHLNVDRQVVLLSCGRHCVFVTVALGLPSISG